MTMSFEVEDNLRAVQRSVSPIERDGRPAHAIIISRAYPTTMDDLWDALTSAERIPGWFIPIEGDLELGGRFQLKDNAGGSITACEPLSHFDLTWEFGGDVSWVNVRISPEGQGSARLALTHTALLSDFWEEYGPGATGVGWEMGLLGLFIHLTEPTAPMPDPAEFAASPEGRALLTGSSETWGQAAIAAGADPDAARAATSRTTAFYTGTA